MMKKSTILLCFLMAWFLLAPSLITAANKIVVRDRSGKAIEIHYIKGNRTEIRSPTGKLLRVEIRKNDRIEVRSPTGRLIRIKKIR
jgi:hypothetical protein